MTAGTTVHAPDGTPVVLAEIGQTMLLENDRVRIWEVALGPGESQPWHLHHNPYLVVNIEASPGRMDWLGGAPPRYVQEHVGGVIFRPTSPVHMLTNIGTTHYRNRLVELRDIGEHAVGDVRPALVPKPAPPEPEIIRASDAEETKTGPVGHHIVFETDLVRAWEIVLNPGAPLTWHRHRNPHVVITLDGSDTRIDTLTEHGSVATQAPGSVRYCEPRDVEALVNVGTLRYRCRLIELKYLGENR
jgi:quercetin dioxygenase-like cupin family protein